MESKSHALIAGVFAIGLMILAGILALWLGKDEIQRTPYTIATKLKVSGLNIQAAVRYKGIKVGKVTDIDFDPKVPGQLLLSLDIVSDTPITQSTFASLGYQGVTGIAYIELDDDGSQPAAVIRDPQLGARIPLRPGLLQEVEKRGLAILSQTEEISRSLNRLLSLDNQKILTNTVQQMGRTAAAWETLPNKLDPILATLPQAISQARESALAFKQFSDNARNTSANVNQLVNSLQGEQGSIRHLSQQVEQLSSSLQYETLPALQGVLHDARGTLRGINRSTDSLYERPQSLLFGPKPTPPGPGEPGFHSQK
ncbi:MlaD family protein [Undibacterium fentianense]|uniref:MCE family protein n=1 Tax=Undibacterium fentianense TaxID=2828728 RepID=A0A941E3M1_9BURK|nr:MlaD family protein [Undibacterium fentianense]MBR7801695.1 MCE family protein [Undibacterium fentianense]